MAFMRFTKKGLSAYGMQRQIGHRWYESIWGMMHRIRRRHLFERISLAMAHSYWYASGQAALHTFV